MATWYEKLHDPRWQSKRLEIMERDQFRCQACGGWQKTLNVHHGYYEKGFDPWSYRNETMWTLCEDCHIEVHKQLNEIYKTIACTPPGCLGYDSLGHQIHIYLRYAEKINAIGPPHWTKEQWLEYQAECSFNPQKEDF